MVSPFEFTINNQSIKMILNSFLPLAVWLAILLCIASSSSLQSNKAFSFSVLRRKNQTGHTVLHLSLDKSSTDLPEQWKMNFQHSTAEVGGIKTFHLDGTFTAPPALPSDYELFPGVGYYKFHTKVAIGFEDASSTCAREGGHLAIVNSEAEHQVMQTMFARHPESQLKTVWAFVGFHDRHTEGLYVTIFGQPLNSTGFTRWSSSGQPDNYKGLEDCGSVNRNGGLNDITCSSQLPFFCEYDLSWSEK